MSQYHVILHYHILLTMLRNKAKAGEGSGGVYEKQNKLLDIFPCVIQKMHYFWSLHQYLS